MMSEFNNKLEQLQDNEYHSYMGWLLEQVRSVNKDITIEEFDKFSQFMKTIDLKDVLEIKDNTDLQNELACAGGVCEVF